MDASETANVLLSKARDDAYALGRLVDDPAVSDTVLGFFGQQAVEKSLKAVLRARGVPFARRHDLTTLMDVLQDAGCALPEEWTDVRLLNPFAVSMRYEFPVEGDDEPLDRGWLRQRVADIIRWASGQLGRYLPPSTSP